MQHAGLNVQALTPGTALLPAPFRAYGLCLVLHYDDAFLAFAGLSCAPQLSRSQPRRVRSAAPGASRTLSTKIDFYRTNPELCMVSAWWGPGVHGQRGQGGGLGEHKGIGTLKLVAVPAWWNITVHNPCFGVQPAFQAGGLWCIAWP